MTRTITVEQVRGRSADDLLHEVTRKQETLRIEITEGEFVEIKPLPKLKPLTCLEGSMPTDGRMPSMIPADERHFS